MEDRMVPEIRFNGFNDDWELCKVGEIAKDTYGGGTPKTQISKYWKGDIPWIQSSDIQLDEVSKVIPKKFITGDAIINSAAKTIPKNSIAIVTRVGFGKLVFMPYSYATSQDFLSLSKLTVSPWFAVYSIYNLFKKEINNIQGTSIKGITKADLLDKQFRIPTQDTEQNMIGNIFKQLDDTITLHQRELNNLKQMKQGFLQKMFPKEGEVVPELRFPGFKDEWELHKLGDVTDRYDNLRIPVTASNRTAGSTPYYGANGIQDNVEGFTHDGEFILVAEDGANNLQDYPVHYVNGKVWINNHAHVLQAKKEITDNRFLMYGIKNIDIEPFLVGGGRAKLNADVMMGLEFLIPSLAEQKKIRDFFKNVDSFLTLQQQELKLLKQTKKAFLQKMFI